MSIYWPSVAKGLTVPLTTVMVMGLVPRIELADKGGILALSFIIAGLVYVHDSFVSSQSGRLLSAALSGFDELKRRLEAQGQTLDQIRNIAGDALASHNTMESLLARSAEAVETGLELERRSLDNLNSGLAETQERLRSGLKELQQSLKVVDKTISEGLYVTAEALNGSLLQIHSAFIQAADALAKNHTEAIEQFGKVAETLGSEIGCRFQQALAENRNETERLIQAVADQVQGLGKN
ncbi:MAG: hypothetical protein FJY85_07660, partial [Deltaproteobacteria bacterium]|nr:hypothetical protein [Deltaproteobacteria bacterium]